MKYIQDMVLDIEDEINGAKEYAEKYVYNKSQGKNEYARMYLEMAQDELKHAKYGHTIATEEIDRLKEVYKPTNEMMEVWEKVHRDYVEKFAWIKQMLAM